MPEPRTYVMGLPVVVTVHDDGRVEYEIDRSEAASCITDYDELPLYDDAGNVIEISDEQQQTDYAIVHADTERYYAEYDATHKKGD